MSHQNTHSCLDKSQEMNHWIVFHNMHVVPLNSYINCMQVCKILISPSNILLLMFTLLWWRSHEAHKFWKLSESSQNIFLWVIRSLLLWVSLLSPRGIVSNQWEVSTRYPPYRVTNLNIRKEELSVRSIDFIQELRFVTTRRQINSQKVLWNLFMSWVCHINYLIFNLPFFVP